MKFLKKNIKYSFFVMALIFTISITGQTKSVNKIISKELKKAKTYFDFGDYLNAINSYRKVLSLDSTNTIANLNSLISRLAINQVTDSSMRHLSMLKNCTIPEVQFYAGKIYHLNSNFDEAIKSFVNYKNISAKKRSISDAEIDYNIACSKNAIEMVSKPHKVALKNIGGIINSKYPDYVPLISPDEKVLYFTSRREGGVSNIKDEYGTYYEDVYVSKKGDHGEWQTPVNVGAPINTNTHDACVALSFDGHQMIIYRTAQDRVTGDLYISNQDLNGWTVPEKLGAEINTPYIETSACFSNDNSVIYFSSTMPGGFGGKDIYRIKKLPSGKWSVPQNLGAVINTAYDDDAPFIHPDGVTLLFSSKGHNSMGDYDVFKTIINHDLNTFSKPENLGYPINTVNPDIFFILDASGTKGYFSSIKKETYGASDIYMIDARFGDNDLKVKQGLVLFTGQAAKTRISLIDVETNQLAGTYTVNDKTGKFILIMNPLKQYKISVDALGFDVFEQIIEPMVQDQKDVQLILDLNKIKK